MASGKFAVTVKKFAEATEASMLLVKRQIAKDLFTKIIQRTPIWKLDDFPGTAKANWVASKGKPITKILTNLDPLGEATIAAMMIVVNKALAGESIYLSNSVPYIRVLEDGKFPIGGNGTWNKTTQSFEKRSEGGWSTQLTPLGPAGMVKVSLSEFQELVDKATRKYKVSVS